MHTDTMDSILSHKPNWLQHLWACDEISGIFYAYKKLNPVPYGEMKVSSINKRLKEKGFAAKIEKRNDLSRMRNLWV